MRAKFLKSGLDFPHLLKTTLLGGGWIEGRPEEVYRFWNPVVERGYIDSQVDNYQSLLRDAFPCRPPFRMKLRARISHGNPVGTFGFGLWNDPFSYSLGLAGSSRKWPSSPNALWFFYGSPPNELHFDSDSSGHGFKASCIVSPSLPTVALVPGASIAFLLGNLPMMRRKVVGKIKRAIQASEAPILVDLTNWHTYEIRWSETEAIFMVDDHLANRCSIMPSCPLGLVIWIDNQYAILSPENGIRFGTIPVRQPQWMEIAELTFTP